VVNVKSALNDLFAQRQVDYMFGNPGSTELPFLAGLPETLDYVTALQEASVAAMAAGYAAITGKTPLVSLHSAPGLGNAMGALHNMAEAHLPAVVVVGQQDSRHLDTDPVLSADLVRIADGTVKWAREPTRPQDVPAAFERAFRTAESGTPGPVLLSIPMDYFEGEASPVHARRVRYGGGQTGDVVPAIADWLASGQRIALVTGSRMDLTDAWDAGVSLAERLQADVFAAAFEALPGFPSNHPLYRHQLPLTAEAVRRVLAGYDRVLVLGARAFRVYPYSAGAALGPDGAVTVISDIEADLLGTEVPGPQLLLADLPTTVAALTELVPKRPAREPGGPRGSGAPGTPPDGPLLSVKAACRAIGTLRGSDTVLVDESISSGAVLMRHWPRTRPRTYLRSTDGGLGFGIPAAVGTAVDGHASSVVCVVGDGSFYYSPQALWTAAQRNLNVKVIVLNNGGYKILDDYHQHVSAHLGGLPSLRLSGTDVGAIARGFGVPAWQAGTAGELDEALAQLRQTDGPGVVDVRIEWSDKSLFA
jgi:benzoylformate decarboxylase